MLFALAAAATLVTFLLLLATRRVVVSTNDVHIIQRSNKTISYGKDMPAGNVYYLWPGWIPFFGISVLQLPVSVFAQNLVDYAGYDKGRVPFMIDIIAFFRINDSNMASQRVSTMKDLTSQLEFILKGVIRTILASSEIEEILEGRSKFGEMFTREVDEQLKSWGVQTVKCIELMDIRDASDSKVISNIMAKKKSLIEMESRTAVAGNMRAAQVAEVEAQQTVEIRKREAEELIGTRAAERDRNIGIAGQKAAQAIKAEERETELATMAVAEVTAVRTSEIERAARVVSADQTRQTQIIDADAQKQTAVIVAEAARQKIVIGADATKQQMELTAAGQLVQATNHAKGVELEGLAEGAAQQAVLMAPVTAQITLAKEIGENASYQTYLVSIRNIEAGQAVGVEQAKALQAANIKVIANTGNAVEGVNDVMQLLTPKGGLQLGAMLDGLKNTETGSAILDKLTNGADHHV